MKISTIICVTSLGFLSYYVYNKLQKEEIIMEIDEDKKEEEIIMEIDEVKEIKEPLTPTQQIVYDHFQLHHR